MRAFVALELPEEFASDIAALSRCLKASIEGRFLPKEAYHLTLAFLGDISEADFTTVTESLEAACAGLGPVPVKSDGLGKFGRGGDATLWLGIAPVAELQLLAERVRGELLKREIKFDDTSFKPHITLARRARIPRISLHSLAFPQDTEASTVTLFKSTLSREGAEYSPLFSTSLRDEAR